MPLTRAALRTLPRTPPGDTGAAHDRDEGGGDVRHLEVRHLRLVAAIADAGGVTRAAARLHLTQSALSHQLRELEARLGTALYARVGRRLVPTAAGERVLAVARRVLPELARAEADVTGRAGDGPTALLRLATECYTCYHWLPPVLARFRARWPRVEVRIVGEATRRPLPALARGDLDVALVSLPTGTAGARGAQPFAYTPLFEDELVAVAAPDHPLAARAAARGHALPADFAGEPLVLYNLPDEESTLLAEVLGPAGVAPGPVTRVELTEAVVALVRAGLGVGCLARWAVAPHVAAGALAAARLGPDGLRRRWAAATRRAAPPSATGAADYVAEFLAMLAGDVGDGPFERAA